MFDRQFLPIVSTRFKEIQSYAKTAKYIPSRKIFWASILTWQLLHVLSNSTGWKCWAFPLPFRGTSDCATSADFLVRNVYAVINSRIIIRLDLTVLLSHGRIGSVAIRFGNGSEHFWGNKQSEDLFIAWNQSYFWQKGFPWEFHSTKSGCFVQFN